MNTAVKLPQQIYLAINGQRTGPFNSSEVDQRIKLNELDPRQYQFWYEGLPDWRPLSEYVAMQSASPTTSLSPVPPILPYPMRMHISQDRPVRVLDSASV